MAVVERWPLWRGRGGILVRRVKQVYRVKFMLTVFHNGNPIVNDKETKYRKKNLNIF